MESILGYNLKNKIFPRYAVFRESYNQLWGII